MARKINQNVVDENKGDYKKEKSCPHHFSDPEKDRLREKLYLISGWDCDYCDKRVIKDSDYLINHVLKKEEHFSLIEKHLTECEEARKVISVIDAKKDNGLTYDNEETLKEKEYCEVLAAEQIRSWGLINRVILPNLKEKKRVGVVKALNIITKEENNSQEHKSSNFQDEVIFLLPRFTPITLQNFSNLLAKDKFFYTVHGNKEINTYEKIITAFFVWRILQKQEKWNYNVYLLENGISKYSSISGNSSALTLYLALLSAYYQKPISREVATTAALDIGESSKYWCIQCFQKNELTKNSEEFFAKNRVVSVGGLEHKIPVAVEVGVKKLILSTGQKEDYERTVPWEVREKLTPYYVKDVEELERLFWEGEFSC